MHVSAFHGQPFASLSLSLSCQIETYLTTHGMDPASHALSFAEFISLVTSGICILPFSQEIANTMQNFVYSEGLGTPSPTRRRRESELMEELEQHKLSSLHKAIAHVLHMRVQGPAGAAIHEMRVNMSHQEHEEVTPPTSPPPRLARGVDAFRSLTCVLL